MTIDEHRSKHSTLRTHLDELFQDYLLHHPGQLKSDVSVEDLRTWARSESVYPSPDLLVEMTHGEVPHG